MTKYDDASWHYGDECSEHLPMEAAGTHIGMFVVWCLLNGHGDNELSEIMPDELADLAARRITPGRFLMEVMDEKFVDDVLSDDGNAFTAAYYVNEDSEHQYFDDYVDVFDAVAEDIYEVPDSWEMFDQMAELISARHTAWIESGRPRVIG